MDDILVQILYTFCVLSALLLVGTFLRAKVPVFRKIFLPASVIGGFVGLLLGPIVLGNYALFPFPEDWLDIWSAMPSVLIVPVVASVPLGKKIKDKNSPSLEKSKTSSNVLKIFLILVLLQSIQASIGLFTQTLFNGAFGFDLYRTYGVELNCGFSGGHGTAGVVGSFLKSLNMDYWEIAQGVTTTTATLGMVGGMLTGILAINVAARKGKTAILKKPSDIPVEVSKGYQMDIDKQESMGRETTMSSSIESLGFHLAIILATCGISYVLLILVKMTGIPLISEVPIWAYAVLVMFGVNYFMQKVGLGNLICTKTKSRISSTFSDYAIIAAIVSLPVRAIMKYIAPILFMSILGLGITFLLCRVLCRRFFDDYEFERSMACYGTATGIFISGLMLLKICDPEFESPVLNDYSVGFSLTSIATFILLAIVITLLLTFNSLANMFIMLGIAGVLLAALFLVDKVSNKEKA